MREKFREENNNQKKVHNNASGNTNWSRESPSALDLKSSIIGSLTNKSQLGTALPRVKTRPVQT